jgi:hypothetical protein
MTTALSYIEAAMGKLGLLSAGEIVSAEDASLGLDRLASLLDAMTNEGMFGFTTLDTIFTLPANTTSRTIGPAMQIALVRPTRLLSGCFSRLDNIDYPLTPISEAEYNDIRLKSTVGSVAPAVCFYDGGMPTGNVYFWPVAGYPVEVHLITPTSETIPTSTTTDLVYPPGYQRYIENALAVEMAPDFGVTPSPMVVGMAANQRRLIKRTNARIPQLDMDPIGGHGNSPSDFYSGYYR